MAEGPQARTDAFENPDFKDAGLGDGWRSEIMTWIGCQKQPPFLGPSVPPCFNGFSLPGKREPVQWGGEIGVVGSHELEGRKTSRHAVGDRRGALPCRTTAAFPPQRVHPMTASEFYACNLDGQPPKLCLRLN